MLHYTFCKVFIYADLGQVLDDDKLGEDDLMAKHLKLNPQVRFVSPPILLDALGH